MADGLLGLAVAVVAVALVAGIWGLFVAPKASRRLPDPPRLVLESLLFGGAAAALGFSARPAIAAAFAVAAFSSIAFTVIYDQR